MLHRKAEQLGIYFPYDADIELAVKKIKGVRWSQTHRCWYLPLTNENYKALLQYLKQHASVDAAALKVFLQKTKAVQQTVLKTSTNKTGKPVSTTTVWGLNPHNTKALQRFVEHLTLKHTARPPFVPTAMSSCSF